MTVNPVVPRPLARRPPAGARQAHGPARRDLPGQGPPRDRARRWRRTSWPTTPRRPRLAGRPAHGRRPQGVPDPLPRRRAAGGEDPARLPGRAGRRRPRSTGTTRRSSRPGRTPDAALVARIEAAGGLLAERFAFCQTMPLDEFLATAEALRPSGYRPVRFRPYADGTAVPGGGRLDPRRPELAARVGAHPRRGPQAGREEPGRGSSFPSMSPGT